MTEYPKPQTTPLPLPPFMPAQSLKNSGPSQSPASTPLPSRPVLSDTDTTSPKDLTKPLFPLPKLRLEIRNLAEPGASDFLTAVNATTALSTAVESVLTLLYHTPDNPTTTVPPTRSVTLILRSMPGVAYTTGSDLDGDHKEIHFSTEYIQQISPSLKPTEILGVLTHEMVHCYQYNAFGSCPGGLIEGIADWVRLNAGLSPPHWRREKVGEWDGGYQRTGYFLEYLERRFGKGTVRRANERLRVERYEEKKFWVGLVGGTVEGLWEDYGKWLKKEGKAEEEAKDEEVEGCVVVEKEDIVSDRGDKPTLTSGSEEGGEELANGMG